MPYAILGYLGSFLSSRERSVACLSSRIIASDWAYATLLDLLCRTVVNFRHLATGWMDGWKGLLYMLSGLLNRMLARFAWW